MHYLVWVVVGTGTSVLLCDDLVEDDAKDRFMLVRPRITLETDVENEPRAWTPEVWFIPKSKVEQFARVRAAVPPSVVAAPVVPPPAPLALAPPVPPSRESAKGKRARAERLNGVTPPGAPGRDN
jgi:hypothetical protein